MAQILVFVLAAVTAVIVVEFIADRTGFPPAALLTIFGLVYALLPGPNIELDPDVVLSIVLPPLLYSAALNSSLLAIRRNLRAIVSLSVLLVLVTAVLVGVGIGLLVPGVSIAAGVALGAAVSPPDPVAALAVGRRAGLPRKLITLIEGEGLLNDAAALTTLSVAVAAVTSGGFSIGLATLRFVLAAAGGLIVGIAVAFVVRWLRAAITDPLSVNSISLATPFAAYLVGEEAHVSGVLAVVVAGLMVGHDTPRAISSASRLQTSAVWRLVDFLLEGFVFLLIGQQLPPVVRGLRHYSIGQVLTAVGVSLGVVLLVRPIWLVLTDRMPQLVARVTGRRAPPPEQRLNSREIAALSWAGTRGVITLAAIFTLPLTGHDSQPFPGRDLLLFCAFVVVVVTLVGQGMTFGPLIRRLRLRDNANDAAQLRNQARGAAVQAALAQLEDIAEDEGVEPAVLDGMRASLAERLTRYRARLDLLDAAEDGAVAGPDSYQTALRARRRVIEAQREELLRWRDAGRLPDNSMRILQTELDHEENTLIRRTGH